MIKKILVTGGAGYIGIPVVNDLLANGYEVVIVDNLSMGGEALIPLLHDPRVTFIKADIRSQEVLTNIFAERQIFGVVHLAAIVGDPACKKQTELAREVNLDAGLKLCDLARTHGAERFLFASTCSNYGKMSDANAIVDEEAELRPVSLYAELKVEFENYLLKDIERDNDFSPTCLRFATAYGVAPRMRFDLTVNEFTRDLTLGRELEVYGEQFWRPYCHVRDFGRAICLVLAADREKVAYNVFNVGETEENYQKGMIVEEVMKHAPTGTVKYVKKDEDPRDYRVSFTKIKEELGYSPSCRVPEGIGEIKRLVVDGIVVDPYSKKYANI